MIRIHSTFALRSAPISKVIGYLPKNIPRILINRTIVHPPEQHDDEDDGTGSSDSIEFRDSYVFDAYLLGYCDNVTRALGKCLFPNPHEASAVPGMDAELEGELLAEVMKGSTATGTPSSYSAASWKSVSVPRDRVFLFPGAEAPTGVSEKASFCEIAHCDGCSKQIEGTIQKCIGQCCSCFVLHDSYYPQ
jgi:hypothetical protein